LVKRNPHFLKLSENYLFPEVSERVRAFKKKTPGADLISLSVGDTSEPLSKTISKELSSQALALGTHAGYKGYGSEQGDPLLRSKIAEVLYKNRIEADEIFISDGAKCDIGRLQILFGPNVHIAVQDPTYPVYVDTSHLAGSQSITYLPCEKKNNFFPDLSKLPITDLLYLCSPNNPTGAVATKEQLHSIISWAKKNKAIVIFDAAYAGFIQDPNLPRSIFEIEGAKEVAIEVNSLSKLAGFTGVRLGWTVIPKKLQFEEGRHVHADYSRLITTFFNGASNLSQAGALAALSPQGQLEIQQTLQYYLENASLLRAALEKKGFPIFGGINAPYLWADFGPQKSWNLFQTTLEKMHLITTPGSGFGTCGEGYLRFSAFGKRTHILEAIERIESRWPSTF